MSIFTVHLNYYAACDAYVPFCFITTAKNNPTLDCYFLTSSPELADKLTGLCHQLGNAKIVCLDQQTVDNLVGNVDSIFYHDGINSRWFDLFSIARHVLVMDFIQGNSHLDSLERFITTDSDIAHFFDYSKLLEEPGPHEVFTRSPIISYFAIWHRQTFANYSSLETMKRYFAYAEVAGGRCSDMHLLEWMIKNESSIAQRWIASDYGIALDTLRDFLYYSGLWIDLCDHSFDTMVNCFPNDIWNSKAFLSKFDDLSFWKTIMFRHVDASGKTRVYLRKSKLISSIKRLNGLVNSGFSANSSFVLYGQWVQDNTWQPYLSTASDLVQVPYVHFQGSTKDLVPGFSEFVSHAD